MSRHRVLPRGIQRIRRYAHASLAYCLLDRQVCTSWGKLSTILGGNSGVATCVLASPGLRRLVKTSICYEPTSGVHT